MDMQSQHISILCADGYELSATLYSPDEVKAAVMIGPATGIKKGYYNAFATFLASNGFGVICYDNRGIGASQKEHISKSKATLASWGELDMPAVLEYLKNEFPNTSYHLIGHSAGGQLLGLMYNAHDIKSMFNFASSSGSMKNMKFPFSFKAFFFLNIFIPLNNLIFGYTNAQWLGMGDPLPKNVAAQWSKWCNGEGYVKVELDTTIKNHKYNEIAISSLWLHATDDDIAIYDNVKDMVSVYPKIKSEIITLHPKKMGYKEIGHMKFFSAKNKDLWKYALDWLNSHS
jgi:predicted alpha/beta hydrolase